MNKTSLILALLLTLSGLASGFNSARAALTVTTYGFVRITDNSPEDTAADYMVEVFNETYGGVNLSTGEVGFKFYNIGDNVGSFIDGVYFDDGTLVGITRVVNDFGDVQYSIGARPAELPGGNLLDVDFVTSAGFFAADGDSPRAENGVGPGEAVGIVFSLIDGQDYNDLLNALEMGLGLNDSNDDPFGALRIGIKVQGLPDNSGGTGQSDSFINGPFISQSPPVAPEPATVLLWSSLGLLSACGAAVRRGLRRLA